MSLPLHRLVVEKDLLTVLRDTRLDSGYEMIKILIGEQP